MRREVSCRSRSLHHRAQLFCFLQVKLNMYRVHKQHGTRSKHFYLLRVALICGHCRNPMGGRTHMAGHQQVYYCVQKERVWKTRGEDHSKWKRGSGCSMVRSANIAKTDQITTHLLMAIGTEMTKSPGCRQNRSTSFQIKKNEPLSCTSSRRSVCFLMR